MALNTKSIYSESEESDGKRVLVTRFYPRGVKKDRFDVWIRGASPEAKLLKEYKSGAINWQEFSKGFRSQMKTSLESKKAVEDIVQMLQDGGNVTLLCYEKEGEKCHRNLLRKIVDSATKERRNKEGA